MPSVQLAVIEPAPAVAEVKLCVAEVLLAGVKPTLVQLTNVTPLRLGNEQLTAAGITTVPEAGEQLGAAAANVTVAVCVKVIGTVESTAVKVAVPTVADFAVPVTGLVVPVRGDGVRVAKVVPLVCEIVIVSPAARALPNWSRTVAVRVLVATPSATRVVGEAVSVEPEALAAPGTSVRVPKFVAPHVTPLTMAPPQARVMLPLASGVPADGRTRQFVKVTVLAEVDTEFTWYVIEVVVRLTNTITTWVAAPVIVTPGLVPPVSKTKPAGALKVSAPVEMSAAAPSVMTGPVRAV